MIVQPTPSSKCKTRQQRQQVADAGPIMPPSNNAEG